MSSPRKLTKDFSRPRPKIEFTVDADVFECRKVLPLPQLQNLVALFRETGVDETNATARVGALMKLMLKKESYARFMQRFAPPDVDDDADDDESEEIEPIDVPQVVDIIKWVISQYAGDRPTTPSSTSSGGSSTEDDGGSSTVGVSHVESTSTNSTPIDS